MCLQYFMCRIKNFPHALFSANGLSLIHKLCTFIFKTIVQIHPPPPPLPPHCKYKIMSQFCYLLGQGSYITASCENVTEGAESENKLWNCRFLLLCPFQNRYPKGNIGLILQSKTSKKVIDLRGVVWANDAERITRLKGHRVFLCRDGKQEG